MVDAQHRASLFLKRLLDIVGGLVGLFVFLPLLAGISLVILWKDGRPIIHRDCRVGRGGATFALLKFRTLRPDPMNRSSVAPEDDPRITQHGLWLRRWRLDEIPELLNVIAGDMSLVGPRPMPPSHAETIPATERNALFSVRPGVTDPAAIHFLAEDTVLAGLKDAEAVYLKRILPAKTEMQLEYIRRWTWWRDLLLLVRTLRWLWSPAQRHRSAREIRGILRD